MSRIPQCPRPIDALGRWLEAYLYRQMQRRRAVSARVLWGWRLCVVIEAVVREGQQAADRVDLWALHHARAILSQPTDVWKINRRGWGWCHVEAWRQRVAPDAQPRAPAISWVWPARIALACLLVFAAWVEPAHAGVSFAALAATTIHEVETGGNDTNNGGMFDPGQTAGMFTDGAATSANTASPVFTSASYNFVAGDVGAWLFVGAGTNWIKGWYKIASVAANAATLSAAIGAAVQSSGATTSPVIPSTVVGCATVASPTGATWSIDYSQQGAAQFTYTDLASVGAGLLVSSVLIPFGKQMVGNSLVITGGTNFTTGRYVIASVSAGLVATVLGAANITTGAGVSGTGGQGGAYATPGITGAHMVGSNQLFVQTGTYTTTSASTNIAAGCFSSSAASINIEGYAAVRGDLQPIAASGTRPTVVASGISTFTLFATSGGNATTFRNVILGGASLTSSKGFSGNGTQLYRVHGANFTNALVTGSGSANSCTATTCATVAPFSHTSGSWFCVGYSNTVSPFLSTSGGCSFCLSYANSGASSDGFASNGVNAVFLNCTAYNNGRDGFAVTGNQQYLINCVAENNAGVGFNPAAAFGQIMINCAAYNNTGGTSTLTSATRLLNVGFITGTAEFFTNPGSGDFSLNATAGGGALLRAAGYPGVFPVGLTTGYLDVGAVQHRDDISIAVSNVAIFQARQSVGY